MRVAIDLTPLESGHKRRGIGFYTKRLSEKLQEVDKENKYVLFSQGQKIPDADIVHYPYFDLLFHTLPFVKKAKTIVTIHDVIPLIFKEFYPAGVRGSLRFLLQELSLFSISHVITDSLNSKKDIQKYLPVREDKISVVPLAQDEIFKPIKDKNRLEKTKIKYKLPDSFLLHVGDVDYRKNLKRLFLALKNLNIDLVMVGEAAKDSDLKETKELIKEAKKLGVENKIHRVGFVSTEELVDFYNLTTFLIEPSLYEGFGLPVLEAMASSCPVISSKESSLPEICGNMAIYVNPYDEIDIERGIRKALEISREKDNYERLKKQSLTQAKKFSWEKTARETLRIYQQVAGGIK